MLLNRDEILELIAQGVIENATPNLVNPASMDVTLGPELLVENAIYSVVDFRKREPLPVFKVNLEESERVHAGWVWSPGQFILAHTEQVFHMPNDVSAEYKLKSSMARIGIEHLHAGWIDPGWHGSVLTLEFKNMLRYHSICLHRGDRIGQITFFRNKPTKGYEGRYNNLPTVSGIKV